MAAAIGSQWLAAGGNSACLTVTATKHNSFATAASQFNINLLFTIVQRHLAFSSGGAHKPNRSLGCSQCTRWPTTIA